MFSSSFRTVCVCLSHTQTRVVMLSFLDMLHLLTAGVKAVLMYSVFSLFFFFFFFFLFSFSSMAQAPVRLSGCLHFEHFETSGATKRAVFGLCHLHPCHPKTQQHQKLRTATANCPSNSRETCQSYFDDRLGSGLCLHKGSRTAASKQ